MKATFDNSLNVLVKAYMNDALKHGFCSACVVGNLLGTSCWSRLFFTEEDTETGVHSQIEAPPNMMIVENFFGRRFPLNIDDDRITSELKQQYEEGLKALKNCGYSKAELMLIEYTFETAPKGNSEDEWMFNGLMAVVDVLADIHQISLEAKEKSKLLFVKL